MKRTIDRNASRTRALFAIGILFLIPQSAAFAFKPLSIPLVCLEPNNNVWTDSYTLSSGNYPWGGTREPGGDSYDFWAYIQIDGTKKRFMGNEHGISTVFTQNSLTVNCTQTIYVFSDQSVRLTITFTSPKLLDELDAVSRPLGYVTFDVVSVNGAGHAVQIGFNTSDGWVVGAAGQTSQTIDFGAVTATPVSRHTMIGHDEVDPVKFLGTTLKPWWNRKGNKTFAQTFAEGETEYQRLFDKCKVFDARAIADAIALADTCYAHLLGQAYRQCFCKNKLVAFNDTTPWFFSLEGSSGNLIQTVDVVHPQSPLFLAYNQNTLKMFLDPVFYLFETGNVCRPTDPPPHDLGPWPTVNNSCGLGYWVEEASNMVIMTAAVAHLDKNAEYVRKHWAQLSRWANWLRVNGLDPISQNSTDDFSGSYPHSCLLAMKACIGIGGYIKMATMAGHADSAAKYRAILDTATAGVIKRGYDYQNRHFKKANDQPGTWSQKYNLIWDRALGLNVFADSIYTNEMKCYLANLNKYGVPLLSGVTYNKSDWELWTAAITGVKSDFLALMHGEWNYTNENGNMCCGICDWHGTTGFNENNFGARGVCGGFFMKICADRCMNPVASRLPAPTRRQEQRVAIVRAGNLLEISGIAGPGAIMIADARGRVMIREKAGVDGRRTINLAGLTRGLYAAVVADGHGASHTIQICLAK